MAEMKKKERPKGKVRTAIFLMLVILIAGGVGSLITLIATGTLPLPRKARRLTLTGNVTPSDSLLIGSIVTLKDAAEDTVINTVTIAESYEFRFVGVPLEKKLHLVLIGPNNESLRDTSFMLTADTTIILDVETSKIIPPIKIFLDYPKIEPGDSVSWGDLENWLETSFTRNWQENPKEPLYKLKGRIINPPPNGRVAVDLYGGAYYWPQSRRPIEKNSTWVGEVCLKGQYYRWDQRLRVYVYTIERDGEWRIHAKEDFYIVVQK